VLKGDSTFEILPQRRNPSAERFPQRTDGTGPGAPQEKCGVDPALTENERTVKNC